MLIRFPGQLTKKDINETPRCGMQAWADHGIGMKDIHKNSIWARAS